jgi:hypothetical protein
MAEHLSGLTPIWAAVSFFVVLLFTSEQSFCNASSVAVNNSRRFRFLLSAIIGSVLRETSV